VQLNLHLKLFTLVNSKVKKQLLMPSMFAPEPSTDVYAELLQRRDCIPNSKELTATEQQTVIRCMLDLDLRGFAPRLCEVADMADKVLGVHSGEQLGKHWAERSVTHSDKLKIVFSRAKDGQRIVIKKEPNQLYGVVEIMAELGTTRKRAKKNQRYLLNLMQVRHIGCLSKSEKIKES
jgi:hypothetical protein